MERLDRKYLTSRPLDTRSASEIAGVSMKTIRRWIHAGHLVAFHYVPQWRIPEISLEEYLAERNRDRDRTVGPYMHPDYVQSPVLTTQEAAQLAHVRVSTIRSWIRRGHLAAWRDDVPQWWIRERSLMEYLQKRGH